MMMISFLYYYYFHHQYYHYYYHIYYHNSSGSSSSSSSSSSTNHSSILAADSTWLNNVPDSEVRKITFGEHSFMRLTVTWRLITKDLLPSPPPPISQPGSYLFKREAKVLKTNGDGLCLGLRLLSVFIQSVPPDILFHSWPSLCEESLCYITFTPFYKFFFVVETKQKQQHHQQYCKDE